MEQELMIKKTDKLTRQQKRKNARLEAKRLAKRAGKNIKGVPRKRRRQFAFDVTTVQLSQGLRKGTEYISLEDQFKDVIKK